MENESPIKDRTQVYENVDNEAEKFDFFVTTMVQIVEKYGKLVLQDLDCVA